jgi:hypothetical protein
VGRPCACNCRQAKAVTIKRFATSDGATVWEYGPGQWWSPVVGGSAILGVIGEIGTFVPDTYVVAAGVGVDAAFPSRPAVANCKEGMSIISLSDTDGTENSKVTIEGWFQAGSTDVGFTVFNGFPVDYCALSTGDYLMLHSRPPQVELVDYNSNPVTKQYIFHAHSQTGGNVTLTTKTSGDTIVVGYNVTSAALKTAIETSGDVASATVTGGPWPLSKMSVSVTWNSAADDFATIKADSTYTVGFGFRNTQGPAIAYNPSTGLITHVAPHAFGPSSMSTPSFLISQIGLVPSVPGEANGAPRYVVAAPGGRVAVTSINGSNGYAEGWTVGTSWSRNWIYYINALGALATGTQVHGGEQGVAGYAFTKGSYPNPPKTRNGALVDVATGTVTEIDDALPNERPGGGYWRLHDESASNRYITNVYEEYTDIEYPNLKFRFCFEGKHFETVAGSNATLLVGNARRFACDGTNIGASLGVALQPQVNYGPPARNPVYIGGSIAKAYYWKFFLNYYEGPYDPPTQFRFNFGGPAFTTGWINWHATAADIKNAILAIFPENTEGVTSNVTVNPFGTPAPLFGTGPFSLLEKNLEILFAGANTLSFIPTSRIDRIGDVQIEFQNVTPRYAGPVSFLDVSNMEAVWERSFGTVGSTAYAPDGMWFRNSKFIAYGPLVENDLP